jgi:FMN-dependent NADH-azoreductase
MTNVLIIDSAATGDSSVTRRLTGEIEAILRGRGPVRIVRRDVGTDTIPHLTAETTPAIRGAEPITEAAREALALSDALIAELQAADLVVIGAPMYNFGIASTLKTWFDHVLRAGITFRYSQAGPEGLLKGKKTIVIESRAGLYSSGPSAAMDSQEPHLRTLLGFMGLDDATFVRVEKLAFGPDQAAASIAEAMEELHSLVAEELPLAA